MGGTTVLNSVGTLLSSILNTLNEASFVVDEGYPNFYRKKFGILFIIDDISLETQTFLSGFEAPLIASTDKPLR